MSYLTGNEAAQHLRGYIAQHLGLYDDEGVAQSKKSAISISGNRENCEKYFSFLLSIRFASTSLSFTNYVPLCGCASDAVFNVR